MLQCMLKVVGGKHNGRVIPLAPPKFLIGRDEDCQMRPNSEMVSRHHCVFSIDDYTLRIRDLGSTNGTYVNDERIRGHVVLKSGDQVRIGKLEFQVIVKEAADVTSQTEAEMPVAKPAPAETSGTETTELGGETGFEIPTPAPGQQVPQESSSDTTVIPSPLPQPNQVPPQPDQSVPPVADGATPPPAGHPPQPDQQAGYPQMPQYPQQGYPPQQYPPQQYPPQQYPGYPQQPYPYPGYPPQQQWYPQQPMPPEAGQPEPADPSSNPGKVSAPPIKLPPPEETGAKD